MKHKTPLALITAGILLATFVGLKARQIRLDAIEQARALYPVAAASASPVSASSGFALPTGISTASIRTRQARPERPGSDALAAEFKSRFGLSLELGVDSAGCLVSVKGTPQKATPADGKFAPSDSAQAIVRAREVIRAASEFLCVDATWPLGEPIVSSSPFSAQASFHETRDGLPVLPFGAVSITLGPKGELLGLDSSYSGGGAIANERKLSQDEARAKVSAALPSDTDYSGKALEGRPILWVAARTDGGTSTVLHAYEYFSHGKQVIVDAGNGAILLKRERRIE